MANGKVQRAFYLPESLAHRLRVVAAERGESQSEIVERAVERELALLEPDTTEQRRRESVRVRVEILRHGEVLAEGTGESVSDAIIAAKRAAKLEPDYPGIGLLEHREGGNTWWVQFGRQLGRPGPVTLSPLYVVHAYPVRGYRAAIYVAPGGQETVLTGPEDAELPDADLIERAVEEARGAGLIGDEPHQVTEQVLRERIVIDEYEPAGGR